MNEKLKKVKLKGNESFNFREGWLRKGMRCVAENEDLFSQDDVMERLGVGSKMVKSIRFWLQATHLTEEQYTNSGRSRSQFITEDFGDIIAEYDPYFDDLFTLFLVHYHIVSNASLCIVWNIFFNEYDGQDFTKENMVNACQVLLDKKMDEGCTYSESSFVDDCSSIIKMYINSQAGEQISKNSIIDTHPEESLDCPLAELGLIQKSTKTKGAFIKSMPTHGALDKLAVLYVIAQNISKEKNSVSIDDLLNAPNNIGRVFNLSRVAINEYLDQLRIAGYLTMCQKKAELLNEYTAAIDNASTAETVIQLRQSISKISMLMQMQLGPDSEQTLLKVQSDIDDAIHQIETLPQNLDNLNQFIYSLNHMQHRCLKAIKHGATALQADLIQKQAIWVKRYIEEAERSYKSMSAIECQNWLDKTASHPIYLQAPIIERLNRTRELVESQLHSCRVDGLLAMYDKLSESEKQTFKKLLLAR